MLAVQTQFVAFRGGMSPTEYCPWVLIPRRAEHPLLTSKLTGAVDAQHHPGSSSSCNSAQIQIHRWLSSIGSQQLQPQVTSDLLLQSTIHCAINPVWEGREQITMVSCYLRLTQANILQPVLHICLEALSINNVYVSK